MTKTPSIERLADALRGLYSRDPDQALEKIEAFLAEELKGLNPAERLEVIGQLESSFPAERSGMPEDPGSDTPGPSRPAAAGEGCIHGPEHA